MYLRGRAAVAVNMRNVTSAIVVHHPIAAADVYHTISAVVHDSIGWLVDDAVLAVMDDSIRSLIHNPVRAADECLAPGNVGGWRPFARNFDRGTLSNHGPGRRAYCRAHLAGNGRHCSQQRLAVAVAFQIEPLEAGPFPLEDHQRPAVVPAPKLADLFAAPIGDPELVFLLRLRRNPETDRDLEVLLRAGRWLDGLAASPSLVLPGYVRKMPGGEILRRRRHRFLCGRGGRLCNRAAHGQHQRHCACQDSVCQSSAR